MKTSHFRMEVCMPWNKSQQEYVIEIYFICTAKEHATSGWVTPV